ncbi:TetR/AcrR family transcriptional regulator [Paenibacillus lupini]|uniref:TetR/AcrR family transcriptional regulator n=1 Tax=Paenibacillus lupini TaxID=1450204 RepID=UPI0014248022|nr:TetR/AcrR family transcriptional regulator [Paenibacillus lupini]NIK25870.1 AcrR family transcriptional regulator [Paenibacillus lupini]
MSRNIRKEQAAETREKILEAAKSLFAEKGYHGTPVREITRKIGMGDGILYHYFPGGKREIMSVLLRESFEHRRKEIQQINRVIEEMDLRDAMMTIKRRIYELFTADMDLTRILFRENELLGFEEAEQLTTLLREQSAIFEEFLKDRHERGEIRDLDFRIASRQFLSTSLHAIMSKSVGIQLLNEPDVYKYMEENVDFTIDLWKNP